MSTDPLSLLRTHHIEKYGWSGSCIKAYRIDKGMSRNVLAAHLKIRGSTLGTYEDELRPVGIKLAKQLGEIFKVDWHVFRKQPINVKILTKEEYDEYEKQKPIQTEKRVDTPGKVRRGFKRSSKKT